MMSIFNIDNGILLNIGKISLNQGVKHEINHKADPKAWKKNLEFHLN
jgi:hypothetical protein